MLIPRIITALILVAIVLGGLFYASVQTWQTGVLILSLIALFESAKLAQISNLIWQSLIAVVGTAIIYLSFSSLDFQAFQIITATVLIGMITVVYRYQKTEGRIGLQSKPLMLAFGFVLVLLFSNALVNLFTVIGSSLLLLSMAVVWAMDTGAYFTGRALGKRKLAKYVSPGKSWEGVWGGAVSAFLLSIISLQFLLPETQWFKLVLLSIGLTIIALLSVYGDLFESVLKRQAQLKDSGRILPGHGGVLDRIDSLLVAVPLSYLLWFWYF